MRSLAAKMALALSAALLLGAGCDTSAPQVAAPEPAATAVAAPAAVPPATVPLAAVPPAAPHDPTLYPVTRVVDGDTIDVTIDGKTERLRLIGINTPETVDPRKPVECFGREASDQAKKTLEGRSVRLEADPTQGERDIYGRLLRYVFLEDGTDFNLKMIQDGYAYEDTYKVPYKYQAEFKAAQKEASAAKRGLWADGACAKPAAPIAPAVSPPSASATSTSSATCLIKGNISSSKIYHLPGCGSYDKTVIDESKGERWFCTEQEAVAAGWRKAGNCP